MVRAIKRELGWASSSEDVQEEYKGNHALTYGTPKECIIPFDHVKVFKDEILGEGGFTCVYGGSLARSDDEENKKIINKVPGNSVKVAVKLFEKSPNLYGDSLDVFQAEVACLAYVGKHGGHSNIVKWYGVTIEPKHNSFLLEYCNGSFKDNMYVQGSEWSWKRVFGVYLGICDALEWLHSLSPKLIHRDVKCANVLLHHDEAKLADFGLAKIKEGAHKVPERKTSLIELSHPCGTRLWMAPELLEEFDYNEKVDVYSFGISLMECIVRENIIDISLETLMSEELGLFKRPVVPDNCDKKFRQLIHTCIDLKPEKRPTMAQVNVALKKLQEEAKGYLPDVTKKKNNEN